MSLSRNTLITFLLISLALNLLIAGALGGAAVAGWRHGQPGFTGPAPVRKVEDFRFSPQRFIHALPPKERRQAVRAMRKAAAEHRKLFRKIVHTRIELARLLSAENWDDAAIDKAFAQLRALDAEQQQFAQKLMLDILRKLDPQTRQKVVRAASMHRHRAPHRHPLPPPPPPQ